MARYIKDIRISMGIKEGSVVTFVLDNEEITKGTIIGNNPYFINAWSLFKSIRLENPLEFFIDTVGEENVKAGGWPYVKGEHNLNKVLNALKAYRADRIPEDKKVIISDDEKKPFTLSMKKNKQTKLNFKL